MLAIDESGEGKHKKAVRLYIYPDEENFVLYVILLGDKNTQEEDIKICHSFVEGLKANTTLKKNE